MLIDRLKMGKINLLIDRLQLGKLNLLINRLQMEKLSLLTDTSDGKTKVVDEQTLEENESFFRRQTIKVGH